MYKVFKAACGDGPYTWVSTIRSEGLKRSPATQPHGARAHTLASILHPLLSLRTFLIFTPAPLLPVRHGASIFVARSGAAPHTTTTTTTVSEAAEAAAAVPFRRVGAPRSALAGDGVVVV